MLSTFGCGFLLGFLLLGCGERTGKQSSVKAAYLLDAVYPRYLDYPTPSAGKVVRTNPPILRWPVEKGRNIRYDIRLWAENEGSSPDRINEIRDIPWAMFNPHEKLASGNWYWQFRKSGEEWSEKQHFLVDSLAVEIVSPDANEFLQALPKAHPRVLASAADLSRLGNLELNEDIRFILAKAEKVLLESIPNEQEGLPTRTGADESQDKKLRLDASKELGSRVYYAVVSLSEAYILSRNEEFAEKAIQIASEVATWEPRGVSSVNDFGDSRCMVAMALVFDTFYDKLSDTEKEALIQAIKPRASHFYTSWINNIEARVLSGHVWQHILHYFFQTCLAVYGDEPEAAEWLAYAYELFLARAPVLGGHDGGWAEGVSYFRMNMETLIDIPLSIKKITGFDFVQAHPWYASQVDWMIYHIPPGSASDGFADNSDELSSPGTDYVAFALELAKLRKDTKAAWYANESIKYERASLAEHPTLRWVRLTKTRDLPIPDPVSFPDLPMGKASTDIGVVAMHSDVANKKNNLMVAMRSSPFGSYGHMLSDQNVFNILIGGKKLFYRTGYKVSMNDPHRTGWYQHTKSQNGIVVDGNGQPYSTEAFGWIARFLQGDDLAYAKGDASRAYQSKETEEDYSVVKNIRHLVLLKPDVILVYDELEAGEAVNWSWLIHSLEAMEIDTKNQTFRVQQENAIGMGRLWASADLSFHFRDTFDVAAVNWRKSVGEDGRVKSYKDNQFHLSATPTKKSTKMRFFGVIQVAEEMDESELLSGTLRNGIAEIEIGNWKISASLDSASAPGLLIQNEKTETVFSSHGKALRLRDRSFSGKDSGSSILGIIRDGSPLFIEAKDELPPEMQSRLRYFEKSSGNFSQ